MGFVALGCAGWPSPPAPLPRAGEPALSLAKRGDQRRALGRPNSVVMLAVSASEAGRNCQHNDIFACRVAAVALPGAYLDAYGRAAPAPLRSRGAAPPRCCSRGQRASQAAYGQRPPPGGAPAPGPHPAPPALPRRPVVAPAWRPRRHCLHGDSLRRAEAPGYAGEGHLRGLASRHRPASQDASPRL